MMSLSFQAKPDRRVAIDIGSSFVKILEVTASGPRHVFSAAGLKKTAGFSNADLSEAIKSLASESAIMPGRAVISVSGPSVVVRFLSMPKMGDADLKSAIKFEAEKLIPFNANECTMDFQVLEKDSRDRKTSVVVCAVRSELVKQRIKIVEDAGFTVSAVDVDSIAVANSFLKNHTGIDNSKVYALLNIGSRLANLTIVNAGVLRFARDISAGGDNPGIPEARAVPNALLDELKLSFSYHENQSGRAVDEIFVSGGYSGITGLAAAVKEIFGLNLNGWNPLQSFGSVFGEAEKNAGLFAVSSGLVMH